MSKILLLGKPCADFLYSSIIEKVSKIDHTPTLYTIGFCNDQWMQYTSSLAKNAVKYNIKVCNLHADDDVLPEDFFALVKKTSDLDSCDGLLLQQPLPNLYKKAVEYVSVDKDIDCLTPLSCAKIYLGQEGISPATAKAVVNLLDFYNIPIQGKNVVIVGRSNTVGKPLAMLLLAKNATVTICHTKTQNLSKICSQSDILISACGKAGLITKEFVNKNTIVIDVGLNFVGNKFCGDVAEDVYDICAGYSPVPGGVGPVTRATLFDNLINAIKGDR